MSPWLPGFDGLPDRVDTSGSAMQASSRWRTSNCHNANELKRNENVSLYQLTQIGVIFVLTVGCTRFK